MQCLLRGGYCYFVNFVNFLNFVTALLRYFEDDLQLMLLKNHNISLPIGQKTTKMGN